MDVNDFREFGRAAIDFVADYIENIRDREVLPSVKPGYLQSLIPGEVPESPENWKDVLDDINRVIVPGLTHWQSPNFHAYYPTQTSYPSIIGELIADGFGIVGFSWICSPACTELEVAVMDWLGKFLNLPRHFLHCNEGPGGGIIQGSASESIFVAVLAAREQAVRRVLKERSDLTEAEIRGRLVAYSSDQSNSAIEKAGILSAVPIRLLPVDDDCSLRGEVLQSAIAEDLAQGKIPCICIATLGTTGTCAYDNLKEVGPICEENKMWFHIDAAYAGAALCCPEFSYLLQGIELADSFNFNLHKWMMVNFDCGAMFLRNANLVTESFNVDRIYLKHQYQGLAMAPDYRHWQIPLGRRFRSLKVWITLRTIGAENIRNNIRQHCKLAKLFEERVRSDDRFEIVKPARMGLVCFRLKGECHLSKTLLQEITDDKKIYMIPATFKDKFLIRFVVCGQRPDIADIDYAWNIIKDHTNKLYYKTLNNNNNNNTDINFNDITRKLSAIELKQTSDTFTDKCDKNKIFSSDISSSVTFENNEKCK